MKRRLCLCLGLLSGPGLIATLAMDAVTASAQSVVTTGPGITAAVKNASSATPYQPTISAFVAKKVADLIGDDAAAQKSARTSLINECTNGSSASYFDVYGGEVNTAVVAALAKKPTLRARLNLAVVVEDVARVGHTTQVEPAAILFLNDPANAVALWGAKAAKPMVDTTIQSPALLATTKLLTAIPQAAVLHPKSGYVAETCYQALNPSIPGLNGKQMAALIPPLIKPMLDLMSFRANLYTTEVADVADADGIAASFLARNYDLCLQQQQQQIVQVLSDLVSSAGQQVGSASKANKEQIIRMLKYATGGLVVITKGAIGSTLNSLVQMSPGTPASTIAANTKLVYPALKPTNPNLNPPPLVTPAPPATEPAAPSAPVKPAASTPAA